MAVNLSPVGGVAGQFFDNNGNPLVGGKLYTYAAGTTTPQATYTSSSGNVANLNPIILNAGGRVPSEIWLTDGFVYKFVLYDANNVLIGSWDNIIGINSNFVNFTTSEEIQTATAGQTVFTLATMSYQPGTNSLVVYVDGVNQYEGSTYSYVETDSTTVTFTSGLHVGAVVKFVSVETLTTIGSNAVVIAYEPAGTGAVTTNVQDKLRETISAKNYGAVGDGVTDDTTAIQNALNAAQNKTLLFVGNETYNYSQLTVKSNTNLITCGCTFNRIAASTTAGFVFENDVNVDSLSITTPGGSGGDKGVLIKGSNVVFGKLSVTATAQGVYNSTNYAVEIESVPSGTKLSNIVVNNFYCKYFSTAMFIKNVELMTVNAALSEYFRLAFYLRDVSRSTFDNVTCVFTSSASYGTPGENGLLIESTVGAGSSDLKFNRWSVLGAGEHSYRIGGTEQVRDIWFDSCRSWASGSSIVVNNPAATEWHGGCGFKVLGSEINRNIFFNNCEVQDCNTTYGTFPAGHGVNNFTPFLIINAENVHMDGCSVSARNQTYAARRGIMLIASDYVYITNGDFRDLSELAITIHEEVPGFAYQDRPVTNLFVSGGLFETTNTFPNGIPFYIAQNVLYDHKNWVFTGVTFKGGSVAMRMEQVSTGSFENIYVDFNYVDSNADNATYTTPIVAGFPYATTRITGPWRNAAFSPQTLDGSWFQDTFFDQQQRYRVNGSWRLNATTDMFANSSTTAVLTDKTSAINTVGKFAGKFVWNNDTAKLYRAGGALDVSIWATVDASGSITPV